MPGLQTLMGKTLILVAHPDDELVLCGGLMQSMERAIVVFTTDGAPREESFWRQYGSREAYAQIRRQEAREALALAKVEPIFLADHVEGGIADQELFCNLPAAIVAVEKIVARMDPNCILAPSYEGGHPDHDAACFIASCVCRGSKIPVWEGPLYHRRADGTAVTQSFPQQSGDEIELRHEGRTLETKIRMFHSYKSQGSILEAFQPERESFRPLAKYDFTLPPLPWKLNYEHWGWSMTGRDVAAAFAEYMRCNVAKAASRRRD